jgi:hypothetical protein
MVNSLVCRFGAPVQESGTCFDMWGSASVGVAAPQGLFLWLGNRMAYPLRQRQDRLEALRTLSMETLNQGLHLVIGCTTGHGTDNGVDFLFGETYGAGSQLHGLGQQSKVDVNVNSGSGLAATGFCHLGDFQKVHQIHSKYSRDNCG